MCRSLSVTALALLSFANSPRADEAFITELEPFFESHCYECHDDSLSKGGLDLFSLEADLTDPAIFARWERIYDRVTSGEMPPDKEPRPSSGDLSNFRRQIAPRLAEAHESSKGTVLRRLNRKEYHHTLNDLFGTRVDLVSMLPEDGRSHEFDTVGSALGISMVQLETYLQAIEAVLNEAIADQPAPPAVETLSANYVDSREGKQFIPSVWGKAPDGAVIFFDRRGYPSGMLRGSSVRQSGYYRVRVTGYAYQSDKPITFSIGGTSFVRGSERPTYHFHAFKPGRPQTFEFVQFIPERYMIEITPWGLIDENRHIRIEKTTRGYPGPGLAINGVELEGPLHDHYPLPGHRLLFDGIDRILTNPGHRIPNYRVHSDHPEADAAMALQRVAEKAFRRPIDGEDIAPYLDLFREQLTAPEQFEAALRAAVSAIFVSPEFLYLREDPGYLGDHELAARLSYAFTRTTPDEILLAVAGEGKLSRDPGELWRQAERLMAGPHFDRFIEDFTDSWLNLREIDFTAPDQVLYPEFDAYLQDSLIRETRAYFRTLISENLPVVNIVRSDFALLNGRLAEHYGIEGVDGPEIRQVSLPPDSVRGGFLSQGSVLKVSANGTNTSPVLRGVWVMERILGETPPPPPPGIPGVEPDIRGAETLRELLDNHRDSESCRGCHEKIDPPGFALESFDPVGGWREYFRNLGTGDRPDIEVRGQKVRYKIGPDVDASGQFADGRKFDGYREFRDHLADDPDRLAKAFARKMLTYASGREMGFSDRPVIHRIVQQSAETGHGMRDLIRLIIHSEIFRKK